ncbi:MAG: serine hydrolase, partial [Bacteroidota bacterium]
RGSSLHPGATILQDIPPSSATQAKLPALRIWDSRDGWGAVGDAYPNLPDWLSLGNVSSPKILHQAGQYLGSSLRKMGIHAIMVPWGQFGEGSAQQYLSTDPKRVARQAYPLMRGLHEAGVMVIWDFHPVPPHKAAIKRLGSQSLPLEALIRTGLGVVQVPDASQARGAHVLQPFQGLRIFTWHPTQPYSTVIQALESGYQVIHAPRNGDQLAAYLKEALRQGKLSPKLVKNRARALLHAKAWLGILEGQSNAHHPGLSTQALNRLELALGQESLIYHDDGKKALAWTDFSAPVLLLSIGDTMQRPLKKYLEADIPVHEIRIAGHASASDLRTLEKTMATYNRWVLALYPGEENRNTRFLEPVKAFIQRHALREECKVVFSGRPAQLGEWPSLKGSSPLLSWQEADWMSQAIAEALTGGGSVKGKSGQEISGFVSIGTGQRVSARAQLQRGASTEFNLDGEMLEAKLDSLVQVGLDSMAFPGCQVLVAKGGKVFFEKAYGHHTYDRKRSVQLDDLYDLASITKVSGPLPALMYYHDEAKFQLDVPLQTYLPGLMPTNKGALKVREILAHQAGLQPYISYWKRTQKGNGQFRGRTFKADSSRKYPVKVAPNLYLHRNYWRRMYREIAESPVKPDQGYIYSGLSFFLWPEIIRNMSGQSYSDFVENKFYNPLGARTLGFNPWRRFPMEKIVPTEKDDYFRKGLVQGYVHDEGAAMMGGISGNAGLFGCAHDLAKLFQMYLNGGNYGGKTYLSAETVAEFTRYQYADQGNRRGLGFDKPVLDTTNKAYMAPSASPESFGHSGFTGTYVWADPDTDILFIFLSNRVYPSRSNQKLYTLNLRAKLHEAVYQAFAEM